MKKDNPIEVVCWCLVNIGNNKIDWKHKLMEVDCHSSFGLASEILQIYEDIRHLIVLFCKKSKAMNRNLT